MKKILSKLLFGIAFFSVFITTATYAEDNAPKVSQLITPSTITIELDPGQVYTDYFEVHNNGTEQFKIRVYALSRRYSDREYKTIDYNSTDEYSLIRNWITFEKPQYTIIPGESVKVYYTVTVPQDVSGLGQYASFISEIINEDEDNTITVTNRLGINFNAVINGVTRDKGYGKIKENKINTFTLTPPLSANVLVENNGNVQGYEHITMEVYPLFSEEPAYVYDNESDPLIVYPETSRFTKTDWNGAPRLGIFKVIQKVEFMGETSTEEKIVFILPIWFIFIIFAIIVLFIMRIIARKKQK